MLRISDFNINPQGIFENALRVDVKFLCQFLLLPYPSAFLYVVQPVHSREEGDAGAGETDAGDLGAYGAP